MINPLRSPEVGSWSTKVLMKPVTSWSRRLSEFFHVGIKMPARQKDQSLRLKGPLVCGYGKIGHRQMVLHRHNQQQRCGGYKTDIRAGLVGKGIFNGSQRHLVAP